MVRDIWSVGKGHLVSWQGTSGQLVRDIWSVGETDDVYDVAAEARRRRALHKKCSKKTDRLAVCYNIQNGFSAIYKQSSRVPRL